MAVVGEPGRSGGAGLRACPQRGRGGPEERGRRVKERWSRAGLWERGGLQVEAGGRDAELPEEGRRDAGSSSEEWRDVGCPEGWRDAGSSPEEGKVEERGSPRERRGMRAPPAPLRREGGWRDAEPRRKDGGMPVPRARRKDGGLRGKEVGEGRGAPPEESCGAPPGRGGGSGSLRGVHGPCAQGRGPEPRSRSRSLPPLLPSLPSPPFHHFLCICRVYSPLLFPQILAESKASQVLIYARRRGFCSRFI